MDNDETTSDSSNEEHYSSANTSTYILIILDGSAAMFRDRLEGKSLFKAVLNACFDLLDRQLFYENKRGGNRLAVGVATENEEESMICKFQHNLPTALKILKNTCSKSEKELKEVYCRRESSFDFGNFLLNCRRQLKDVPSSDYLKHIFYITNDSDPVLGDDEMISKAVNQAKALPEVNVKFELVTFNANFEYKKFFREFLYSCDSKYNYEYLVDTISLIDKVISLLTLRGVKHSFYMSVTDPNSHFETIEKTYINERKSLNNIKVRTWDHKEVDQIIKTRAKGTFSVAGFKSISLNNIENQIFINDGIQKGFSLIGTSSGLLSDVQIYRTDPKFLQESHKNPSKLFNFLWDYCKDKKRTLICARKYRVGTSPIVCELKPYIINGVRSFSVIGMLFHDNLKHREEFEAEPEADETENDAITEAAERFVRASDFEYDPLLIEDSVGRRRTEYVRSELLAEDARDVPDVSELTLVDSEEAKTAAGKLAEFAREPSKRKAAKTTSNNKRK